MIKFPGTARYSAQILYSFIAQSNEAIVLVTIEANDHEYWTQATGVLGRYLI